ncbi:hypothetical protein [Paenarthrobacter aurescens]|uniref:Serine acetyltransferase n=1 Tax=Paenarthrobacter aurescens TaxID=43663 RepID=A0A4Y3NFI7_PAEAU|nr:hypothetical protein [Paenarthrobacter aurescens]MDO6144549.1 hypothetical protein [Paenarthrobacter aurescens]MDO6148394.1 hypothetical protein [Paenarthrobacter aurescens]MDO6159640.1 hypothetical protein [Paenarthrobacter aurescens]MDO6164542.1 hypothetical protein [Paenarthrobacter aurescens]GEB17791.1 hypothetical protein AAU01_05460 [Paenarthrobacter aurescens]
MTLVERLVYLRRFRVVRAILSLVFGIDSPAQMVVGEGLRLVHSGRGTVFYPLTTIGTNVRIYHQVTLGRKDAHLPLAQSKMERLIVGDDVVIFPGAKVLAGDGITSIGNGTIIAANAVLMSSTGDYEIWAGIPARRVGIRDSAV